MSSEQESPAVPPSPPAAEQAPAPKKTKPANNYYYWHGHEKERAAVGDVAPLPTPVIVKTDDADSAEAVAARAAALRLLQGASAVKKYSWSDGSKFVTVYLSTSDGAADKPETLDESSVHVEYTKVSFTVSFETVSATENGKRRAKHLSLHLAKVIDPSKCEVKLRPERNEIQLKLAKGKTPETWYDLVGTAKEDGSEEDAEDGDALE